MIYGYARVSTHQQDLQNQINQLESVGCTRIFQEKYSGAKMERKEFNNLLAIVESGDTIVVTKLDRFARSTAGALQIIKELFEKEVKINVLNMGLIDNTPTGRLIFTIFSAFAEFERDLIVERTQEGKALARKNPDYREGRPNKYSQKQLKHAISLLEKHTYKEVTELTGISKSTLIRQKNKVKK